MPEADCTEVGCPSGITGSRQHRGSAYLHLSWSDRLGFEFRKDKNGLPTRLIIAG